MLMISMVGLFPLLTNLLFLKFWGFMGHESEFASIFMKIISGPSSSLFFLLTGWSILVGLGVSFLKIKKDRGVLTGSFIILGSILCLFFVTNSFIVFFMMFEFSLIPIFFMISGWGRQPERVWAGKMMLFYTLFASMPLLLFILIFLKMKFSLSCITLLKSEEGWAVSSYFFQMILILAFLVKLPMFFFHQWLPKAHVQAPVFGSMVLAAILLKTGSYGLIKILEFFNSGDLLISVASVCFFGGSLAAVLCCFLGDAKVLIAYSSVVHMSLAFMALSSMKIWGLKGALILFVTHGFASSGLFFCMGLFYERAKSLKFVAGASSLSTIPVFGLFLALLMVNNMGTPPSASFFGEILGVFSGGSVASGLLLPGGLILFGGVLYSVLGWLGVSHGKKGHGEFPLSSLLVEELAILAFHSYLGFVVILLVWVFYFFISLAGSLFVSS